MGKYKAPPKPTLDPIDKLDLYDLERKIDNMITYNCVRGKAAIYNYNQSQGGMDYILFESTAGLNKFMKIVEKCKTVVKPGLDNIEVLNGLSKYIKAPSLPKSVRDAEMAAFSDELVNYLATAKIERDCPLFTYIDAMFNDQYYEYLVNSVNTERD